MRPADIRRVTLVTGTASGGLRAHVRMLAEGLAGRGVSVTVAGPRQTGLETAASARFAPVEITARPRPADVRALRDLRRLLAGDPPDTVHAHGMRAGALAAIALAGAARGGRPGLVVTVHNAPPDGGGAARLVYLVLERVVARRADLILAVSSDLERRMRDAGAARVERALVPAPGAAPVPANPDRGRPLILAVGRLAPQKGFGTLLDAAPAWRRRAPEPRLLIAGDGPLRADLRARAARLGVDAEFPGRRGDIGVLLARASVFVMPSRWEGQPLALQEALAAGVPVVASDTGGIGDLTGGDIGSGGAALLVEPGNARRLGQAVARVLDDDALAGRLRDAARDRAARLPSPDDAVTAALGAYARARQ